VDSIEVLGVQDAATFVQDEVDLSRGKHVTIWVTALPENADINNVEVTLSGNRVPVTYAGGTQVNAEVPENAAGTTAELRVGISGVHSSAVPLRVTRSDPE
jgi:uncharacterized protein (TIGR03437 family)